MIKKTLLVAVCLIGTSALFAQTQKKEIIARELPANNHSVKSAKMEPAKQTNANAKVENTQPSKAMKPLSTISEVPVKQRKETSKEN